MVVHSLWFKRCGGSAKSKMSQRLPVLTIVVPCYNEAEVIPETARRLSKLIDTLVLNRQVDPGSHICFVDDGSSDQSWAIIRDLRLTSSLFSGLKLSRNRGHQTALLAGLMEATGDIVISLDADLQDDLGAIPKMIRAYVTGSDIIYGVRDCRLTDTVAKRISAHAYYRLLRFLGVEIIFDHADFRLLSRRVVDSLRMYNESNLFLRALIPQLGFRSQIVTYQRANRFAGESKYSVASMCALAWEGITSFSTRPLRIITAIGCAMSFFALALTAWAVVAWLAFAATVPGWASTVIPIYLVCGVQMLSMGVIGEYIGKIYVETKRRPRYHIEENLTLTFPVSSKLIAISNTI